MSDEQVYVVPRAAVLDEAGWYGLRTDGLEPFVAALERDGRYEPRDRMEADPSYKQVIPYLVLRDGPAFFLMQRTTGGGDARLHGRYSIGVGGHLNPGDDGVLGGLRREWAEEVDAAFVPEFRLVGLLNDDTTEVGAVHLGAVYVADAAGSAGGDPRDRQADRIVRPGARGRGGRGSARDVEQTRVRIPRRRTIRPACRAAPIIAGPGQRSAGVARPADMPDSTSSVED